MNESRRSDAAGAEGRPRAGKVGNCARRRTIGLVAVALVALALRVHRLAEPLVRWDEGWSVAHASLSWPEIVEIASWEVHPPLFYLLLKPWLVLGRPVFLVRFFPVMASVLAVPLAFRVARRWLGREEVAWLASALTAVAPALVYYGQVLRMYPLVVVWLLLAAWALLAWLDGADRADGRWALAGLVLAGLAGLYTLYYTAFALAGLYIYGLLVAGRRRTWLLGAGIVTAVLYVPWVAYAGRRMLERMSDAAPAATIMPVTPWQLVASAWTALTFDFGPGGCGALTILALLVLAALVAWPPQAERKRGSGIVLTLLVATVGSVLGSGVYFFAPRLLIPAVPFLLLLVAWALDRLRCRSPWLLAAGAAALVLTFWPTSSRFVYEKSLEVSGPFDPHEHDTFLSGRAQAGDFVFFNELALAGWYELDRGPGDPAWGYALRWTPIIEPLERVVPRVERALAEHGRLWFVLYQGTFGPGAELKDWLDGALCPVSMDWGTDSLILSYVQPATDWRRVTQGAEFGPAPGLVRLEAAEYSAQPGPGGEVGVVLYWRALQAPLPNCRVVVQIWDDAGTVLAQRDVRPANWERPTQEWATGEVIEDRHGLLLSGHSATPLHLAVSFYDSGKGEPLAVAGGTFIELGTLAGW